MGALVSMTVNVCSGSPSTRSQNRYEDHLFCLLKESQAVYRRAETTTRKMSDCEADTGE